MNSLKILYLGWLKEFIMAAKEKDVYRSLQGLVMWITEKVEKSQTFGYFLKLTLFLSPCASNHYLLILALPILLVILVLGGITVFELFYIYSTRYSLQVILDSNSPNLQPSELHIPRNLLGMQRTLYNINYTQPSASSSKNGEGGPISFASNDQNSVDNLWRSSYISKLSRSNHMLLASNVETSSVVLSHYFEIDHVAEKFEQPLLLWTEMARFGNHVFQYAAAYVTAKKTGHIPCISSRSDLLSLFGNIKALAISAQAFQSHRFPVVREEKTSVFLPSLVDQVRGMSNVHLQGYFQSWKYLTGYENDIREQYRIRDDIMSVVVQNIKNYSEQHFRFLKEHPKLLPDIGYNLGLLKSSGNFTRIGVHVRRGDLDTFYFRWRGMQPAPIDYINGALNYYRKKYPNRLFLVCSDDINWCKENLSLENRDVIFVESGSYRQDFALLTQCEHSVITSGSFGWWAAWLAGGNVVYYSGFPAANSSFGKQYNKDDYYPPTWVPMP